MDHVNQHYWSPEFRSALTPVDCEYERLKQWPEEEILGLIGHHMAAQGIAAYRDFIAAQPEVNHPRIIREARYLSVRASDPMEGLCYIGKGYHVKVTGYPTHELIAVHRDGRRRWRLGAFTFDIERTEILSHRPRVVDTHEGFTTTEERTEDIQRAAALGMAPAHDTLALEPRYNEAPIYNQRQVFTMPADHLDIDFRDMELMVNASTTAVESTQGLAEDLQDEAIPVECLEECS